MVDADRLARLLDHIRRDVGRLADTARRLREPPSREVESLDAVKYRFVTAIEGCVKVAHHIAASEGWGAADTSTTSGHSPLPSRRGCGRHEVARSTPRGGRPAAGSRSAYPHIVPAQIRRDHHAVDHQVLDVEALNLLNLRLAALETRLRALGSVLVAFSGGADSAMLLAAATRALGSGRVAAATAVSDSLAAGELDRAREFAADLGVRLVTPRTSELDREGYRANAGDRCYFCKAELLDTLGPVAAELGLAHVVTGTNADDAVAGFRPGIRAAAERGALTPLRDAGLTKAQIRQASRRWSLPTWDKPAAACLSSRIAYGVQITASALARVDRAEVGLRAALATAGVPVRDLRVRDLGAGRARVEVDESVVAGVRGCEPALVAVREAGFDSVEVDPRGFRSGSMNELLAVPHRYR